MQGSCSVVLTTLQIVLRLLLPFCCCPCCDSPSTMRPLLLALCCWSASAGGWLVLTSGSRAHAAHSMRWKTPLTSLLMSWRARTLHGCKRTEGAEPTCFVLLCVCVCFIGGGWGIQQRSLLLLLLLWLVLLACHKNNSMVGGNWPVPGHCLCWTCPGWL